MTTLFRITKKFALYDKHICHYTNHIIKLHDFSLIIHAFLFFLYISKYSLNILFFFFCNIFIVHTTDAAYSLSLEIQMVRGEGREENGLRAREVTCIFLWFKISSIRTLRKRTASFMFCILIHTRGVCAIFVAHNLSQSLQIIPRYTAKLCGNNATCC